MKKNPAKIFNIIGIVIGIVIIFFGFHFMNSPADSYSASSAESVKFGGDFYTYQYEATRIAAGNAAVTANNIREVGEKLADYAGMIFVFGGAPVVLHYSKELAVAGKNTDNMVYLASEENLIPEDSIPEL